jgi:uncharacterized protein (DUF433 family)
MNGRIIVNPAVCHGKPCIAGTRIMVTNILSQMAGGYSIERIMQGYPELERDDILAALEYAVAVISDEELIALPQLA